MADLNFREQTYIDPAALTGAFQNKAAMEEQMRANGVAERSKRFSSILDAVQQGQKIAANMMELAKEKDKKAGRADLNSVLAEPAPTANVAQPIVQQKPIAGPVARDGASLGTAASTTVQPTSAATERGATRMARLQQALLRADPDNFTKEMLQGQFPNASSNARDEFQQSAMQIRDKQGNLRTVMVSFRKNDGRIYDPVTQRPIDSGDQLEGLLDRGFAQKFRPAGSDVQGREVVAEERTGQKFVITGQDANGDPIREPYNGRIFPKLENLPAEFTDALGELKYTRTLLSEIKTNFSEGFVGPVAARIGKISQYVEGLADADKARFYGDVAELKNATIRAITGAQLNKDEVPRIMQQLPNENTAPVAFLAQWERTLDRLEERLNTKVETYGQAGYVPRTDRIASPEQVEALLNRRLGKLNGGGTPAPTSKDPLADKKAALRAKLGLGN